MVVCVSVMPRSAIMMTKSLKLNLKLVYQLTHSMMICPSKCRPLNNASTGTNRCILSSSPDHDRFAPEPDLSRFLSATLSAHRVQPVMYLADFSQALEPRKVKNPEAAEKPGYYGRSI